MSHKPLDLCHPPVLWNRTLGRQVAIASVAARSKRLPYAVYLVTVLALCLSGLALSSYLSVSHYRVHTDIMYQSFCALSKAFNCDTVSQSKYAVIYGLPVSVWGIFGYLFFILLTGTAVATPNCPRGWDLLYLTSLLFSVISGAFAGVSAIEISSYCILCILTYAVNFLLLFFTWLTRRRFPSGGLRVGLREDLRLIRAKRSVCIPALSGIALALVVTWYCIPAYWQFRSPEATKPVPSGVTEAGHAWIGANHPILEITEFTDYQCFQCRKMHHYLRELVVRYPDKIRLVHRNYPMDNEFNPVVKEPFHIGSGRMALLAIHASAVGRFWEMNDLLFEQAATQSRISVKDLAFAIGMDPNLLSAAVSHEPYRLHLLQDIREGMKLGISGTPSYFIGGNVYEGWIPPELLQRVTENP